MTNEEVLEAIMRNSSIYEGIREVPVRKVDDGELRSLLYASQGYLDDLDTSIEELEEYLEEHLNA